MRRRGRAADRGDRQPRDEGRRGRDERDRPKRPLIFWPRSRADSLPRHCECSSDWCETWIPARLLAGSDHGRPSPAVRGSRRSYPATCAWLLPGPVTVGRALSLARPGRRRPRVTPGDRVSSVAAGDPAAASPCITRPGARPRRQRVSRLVDRRSWRREIEPAWLGWLTFRIYRASSFWVIGLSTVTAAASRICRPTTVVRHLAALPRPR